jgi:hypothetical protein
MPHFMFTEIKKIKITLLGNWAGHWFNHPMSLGLRPATFIKLGIHSSHAILSLERWKLMQGNLYAIKFHKIGRELVWHENIIDFDDAVELTRLLWSVSIITLWPRSDKVDGPDMKKKQNWSKWCYPRTLANQLEDPSIPLLCCLKDGCPEKSIKCVFVDFLLWDWEYYVYKRTCWQEYNVSDFVEWPNLFLLR